MKMKILIVNKRRYYLSELNFNLKNNILRLKKNIFLLKIDFQKR